MGIEEIKKAKEEAKKTITRPSQKVAALLIALGPATASEILKNIKDEDLLDKLGWFPLPEMGATWGNYMYDIALGEAVANILGKTIFNPKEPQSQHIAMPHLQTTRSQGHHSKALKVSKPAVRGMYLTQEHRVILEQQTEKKN